VDAGDADAPLAAVDANGEMAVLRQGAFVLGNLIALGKVRVEVIFPGKDGLRRDLTVSGQGHFQGAGHRLAVEHRQRPRHPQAHFADLGVGGPPENRGAAAKDFGRSQQLGVNLQPDDGFVGHFLPPKITEG
jgi:hypothetical protein